MKKQQVRELITEIGVVPVVRASSAEKAMVAADAIRGGGVPIVEITMTVPGAIELIGKLAATFGSRVLVGAGTVLDADVAHQCVQAGAQFLVTPGLDLETVRFAVGNGTVIMAGALTPTEVITAWKAGADFVKVFPCGQVGGPRYIKALRGPLPQVPLVPTGGVNLQTAGEFIEAGAAALGVGGELVDAAALRDNKPEIITENARKFVAAVKEARARMLHSGRTAAAVTV